MQEKINWYREQHPQKKAIIVTTRTIICPHLAVVGITYVQDIPKSVWNMIQAIIIIQGHPIFLTDADYAYILDKIDF